MSVIIRLQNLPWNANAIDIRRFFQGLSIPDGGVHIVGGDKGDAFIAFTSDEDARQAMQKDGGRISSAQIKLMLSSKNEMQNVIAAAKGTGLPSAPQLSSGGVKEVGYFDRSAGPAGPYGPRDMVGQKLQDAPLQSGFQGDSFRDRLHDFVGRQPGSVNRIADERLQFRGSGEAGSVGPVTGGSSLGSGPYTSAPESRQLSGAMARPLLRSGDTAGFRSSGSPIRSHFGESGLGSRDILGSQWGLGQPTRQDELNIEERRRFNEIGPDSRYNGRIASDSHGKDTGFGVGGRDYQGPDFDLVNERRDLGMSGVGRNFGRPEMLDDGGRLNVSRFGGDRSVPSERDFENSEGMHAFGRSDARRDFGEGREYSRMDMPSEYMRREEVGRSGWPEERASRLEGMEDFGGRRDPDARFGMNAGAPSAAGRNLFGQGDDIEGSRPPVRYDITGSRYGPEAGLPENRAGGRGGRIPDLRDISVAKPLQHTRPRDPFQEEAGLQDREWQNDPRHISQTKSAERLFDGFSGEKFAPDRKIIPPQGEEWPASGRVFGDRGHVIEDPREQFTVKCTNFPCTFNYKEVRRFFSGCEIPREGLKLVNDRSGSRTGTAYVRFMNSRAVSTAVGMNGRMAQDCKVRVERCSLEEYNSVNDGDVSSPRQRSRSPIGRKHAPDDQPGVYYFVAKKLPPKVDRADMKKFFGRFRIAADGGPFMELAPNNSPTGNALVAIEKLRNPVEVISILHRSVLNGANVEVISVNKSEYDERTKRCRQTKSKERNEVKSDAKPKDNPKSDKETDADKRSFCVHVRGIPYNANATNIEDFFRGLDIPVNGIRIVLNREGRAAGDAFVEFTNSVDQKKALEKDKQHMGHRYIEVRPISRQSMINEHRALQKQCGGPPVNDDLSNRNPPDDLDSNLAVSMQNLHPNTQLEDILDFFRGHRPIVDTIKLQYKDGKPTGDGLVAFPTQQEAENAVRSKNRHFLLGRLITLSVWSKK